MKKLILLSLLAVATAGANAQVTSLFENFNSCDSVAGAPGTNAVPPIEGYYPSGWYSYSVMGDQVWRWYAAYGVGGSPCMEMNGYSGGTDWQNEDWLITPKMNLGSYTNIYLNFFAHFKYAGDSLHIMVSNNYTGTGNPDSTVFTWHELAHPATNMYSDTFTSYREFQVNLTPYKAMPLYVGFKYTSSNSDGSRWNVDSVFTDTALLTPTSGVQIVNNMQHMPLAVTGAATPWNIDLMFTADAGEYELAIYDMTGRKVYGRKMEATNGTQVMNITNTNLASGVYILKLGNEIMQGTTKFTVE